jgi:hypothetical protein
LPEREQLDARVPVPVGFGLADLIEPRGARGDFELQAGVLQHGEDVGEAGQMRIVDVEEARRRSWEGGKVQNRFGGRVDWKPRNLLLRFSRGRAMSRDALPLKKADIQWSEQS